MDHGIRMQKSDQNLCDCSRKIISKSALLWDIYSRGFRATKEISFATVSTLTSLNISISYASMFGVTFGVGKMIDRGMLKFSLGAFSDQILSVDL